MAVIAKWANICPNCGKRFAVGFDRLTKDNDSQKWVHVKCASQNKGMAMAGKKYTTGINVPIMVQEVDLTSLADDEPAPVAKKKFQPTIHQQAVFDFVSDPTQYLLEVLRLSPEEINRLAPFHAVIEAVAGSGKTTTIVEALELTPKDADVGFVAFNRHIAAELKKRAPAHVYVSTLHALGLKAVMANLKGVKIDEDKVSVILDDIYPVSKNALEMGVIDKAMRKTNYERRDAMRKLVSICKSVLCDGSDRDEVEAVIDRYGIEIENSSVQDDVIEKLPDVLKLCKERVDIVDFDDMIWMPLVCNMTLEKFDFLMVDEAQDMNKSQIDFILKSVKDNGRVIAVGDRHQSLYGFRGADTEAIPNLIKTLNATVLPLSITFRCPVSHVEKAKEIVPQIEARPGAKVGVVDFVDFWKMTDQLKAGDMVICRTNSPLVKPAFECIAKGKKAIIRGKDIGKSLIDLVKKFETDDLGQFEISLGEWFQIERQKMLDRGKEMQAVLLTDKVETLRSIINESKTVGDVMSKILMLFDDNNIGIVFSSIHRAKGLEADRVFIMRTDLLPHPNAKHDWQKEQEKNAKYVAYTRSKDSLFFIKGDKDAV